MIRLHPSPTVFTMADHIFFFDTLRLSARVTSVSSANNNLMTTLDLLMVLPLYFKARLAETAQILTCATELVLELLITFEIPVTNNQNNDNDSE